jgi:hypothetical protein
MPVVLIVIMLAGVNTAFSANRKDVVAAEPSDNGYLLSTPQIHDPLRPLAHIGTAVENIAAVENIKFRAVVVSVADPVETHLSRMFDIQLSSLLRAFHAKGYVLDGFALKWKPRPAGGSDQGKSLPAEGTGDSENNQRDTPSVLLFRKDLWRAGVRVPDDKVGAEYVALFLVGESPTFGLQPEAFSKAAKCAAALNNIKIPVGDSSVSSKLKMSCPKLFDEVLRKDVVKQRELKLEIIGPTFSGSMQSLALMLGKMLGDAPQQKFDVQVTSPSATVISNAEVEDWIKTLAGKEDNQKEDNQKISYSSLAASLEKQLVALCQLIPASQSNSNIVILAEESTFGRGVYDILKKWSDTIQGSSIPNECWKIDPATGKPVVDDDTGERVSRIRVTQFPQNIAAVRAEHSRLDQQTSQNLRNLTQSSSRLLELDLSKVDESVDRPPPYNRALSSRSDELMLYGTFDALRVYVEPAAVAIVATDIRDRLFLLNEVRRNLPMALPVLMEMDFLTAHPDYRKISRGSVVIPSGETLVRLNKNSGVEIFGWKYPAEKLSYFSFPADYSANIFRAALTFIDDPSRSYTPTPLVRSYTPTPLVTTLAGFQHLDGSKSKLLAADSRLSLEIPVYLLLLAAGFITILVAWMLLVHGEGEMIMMRPLTMLAGILINKRVPVTPEKTNRPGWTKQAPILLMAVGAGLTVIAFVQLLGIMSSEARDLRWDLPHGRDEWALTCLFLFYIAVAIVGFWRFYLWRLRYKYNSCLASRGPKGLHPYAGKHVIQTVFGMLELGAWAVVSIPLLLLLSVGIIPVPQSVDPLALPMVMSILLLPVGAWFLFQFRQQVNNWIRCAMVLGRTMDWVSKNITGTESSNKCGWPNPQALGERPQSPFNLQFRKQDMEALNAAPGTAVWAVDTHKLMDGNWPFGSGPGRSETFLGWQARLVAEMRFASVAVRTFAWCAILAPTIVLISMDVYPVPWARFQTIVSVALIVASFLLVMYAVVRLENHPLLSRMFTLHGDRQSVGSTFSVLWPKFLAAVIILVPVFFPDFFNWIYSLLQSINSLQ